MPPPGDHGSDGSISAPPSTRHAGKLPQAVRLSLRIGEISGGRAFTLYHTTTCEGAHQTNGYCWRTYFHPLGPTFLDRHLHGPVPSKKAWAKLNFRLCRVRQQYPAVLVGMDTEEGERVPEASAVSWSHYWFGAMTMSPLTGVRGASPPGSAPDGISRWRQVPGPRPSRRPARRS